MPRQSIDINARYYRRFTNPGVERLHTNFNYATVPQNLPLSQTALVCLDCWDKDNVNDMWQRDEKVMLDKIVPLIKTCREAGLQLIHAPSPEIARRDQNWVNLLGDEKPAPIYPNSPVWPPPDQWPTYQPPHEPEWQKLAWVELHETSFHPLVKPINDESVVANGEELHRLCAKRGIIHLLYVGFHTPGCMTLRDYAPTPMKQRGYHCILLRDCTNGFERFDTVESQELMKSFITYFEMIGIYTITSDELAHALHS